jgi:hypothetical protein
MFECFFFIQFKNSLLLWTNQQSSNHTIFLLFGNPCCWIWLWKYGIMMVLKKYFVVSKLDWWLSLNVKSHLFAMHLVFFALLGHNDCLMVLVNTTWKGSKLPFVVSDATTITCLLSFTPSTWIYLAPLLSHVLLPTIGTTCIPI